MSEQEIASQFETLTDGEASSIQAVLVSYAKEGVIDRRPVTLPASYDGDPHGDTVPFCVGSNQKLEIID